MPSAFETLELGMLSCVQGGNSHSREVPRGGGELPHAIPRQLRELQNDCRAIDSDAGKWGAYGLSTLARRTKESADRCFDRFNNRVEDYFNYGG